VATALRDDGVCTPLDVAKDDTSDTDSAVVDCTLSIVQLVDTATALLFRTRQWLQQTRGAHRQQYMRAQQ
jgi:hypothetical protein